MTIHPGDSIDLPALYQILITIKYRLIQLYHQQVLFADNWLFWISLETCTGEKTDRYTKRFHKVFLPIYSCKSEQDTLSLETSLLGSEWKPKGVPERSQNSCILLSWAHLEEWSCDSMSNNWTSEGTMVVNRGRAAAKGCQLHLKIFLEICFPVWHILQLVLEVLEWIPTTFPHIYRTMWILGWGGTI